MRNAVFGLCALLLICAVSASDKEDLSGEASPNMVVTTVQRGPQISFGVEAVSSSSEGRKAIVKVVNNALSEASVEVVSYEAIVKNPGLEKVSDTESKNTVRLSAHEASKEVRTINLSDPNHIVMISTSVILNKKPAYSRIAVKPEEFKGRNLITITLTIGFSCADLKDDTRGKGPTVNGIHVKMSDDTDTEGYGPRFTLVGSDERSNLKSFHFEADKVKSCEMGNGKEVFAKVEGSDNGCMTPEIAERIRAVRGDEGPYLKFDTMDLRELSEPTINDVRIAFGQKGYVSHCFNPIVGSPALERWIIVEEGQRAIYTCREGVVDKLDMSNQFDAPFCPLKEE